MLLKTLLKTISRDASLNDDFRNGRLDIDDLHKVSSYYTFANLNSVINKSIELSKRGYNLSLEYMGGEDTDTFEQVENNTESFIELVNTLSKQPFTANICLDLSTIGLAIDHKTTINCLSRICESAQKRGLTVILSMEEPNKVDDILAVYTQCAQNYGNLGITLQAYLKRTLKDIAAIAYLKPIIRLVKGVYTNNLYPILTKDTDIRTQYIECIDQIKKHARTILIATADSHLIYESIKRYNGLNLTFEGLHGVKPTLYNELNKSGHPTCIYLCYGEAWFTHTINRISENQQLLIKLKKVLFEELHHLEATYQY